jgi:hypothetical protein
VWHGSFLGMAAEADLMDYVVMAIDRRLRSQQAPGGCIALVLGCAILYTRWGRRENLVAERWPPIFGGSS